MSTHKVIIPLCRSEFLQDVSIELGRRLKALRHGTRDLTFGVGEDRESGDESFYVTTSDCSNSWTEVYLWEDKIALYLRATSHPTRPKRRYTRLYADLSDHSAEDIALIIRDTIFGEEEALAFWKRRDAKLEKS